MKTTLVRIYAIDWEKLKKIKTKHGFPNYAETVGYILQKFPEMIDEEKGIIQIKPRTAMDLLKEKENREFGSASPIIDAEKLQNTKFIQLGEVKKS